MRKNFKKYGISFLLCFSVLFSVAQENCFPSVKAFQFVYDQADILTDDQEEALNNDLKTFTKNTSNVLVVVTTKSLCGYDKAEYTYTFADKVGAGREDLDNGVVLMVKPKEIDGQGETFIAVGNGLQGVIPDIVAGRDIVRKELLPFFKQKDYYGGIQSASKVIMALASGEISEADYRAKDKNGTVILLIFILVFIVLVYLSQKYGKGGDDWENFGGNGKQSGRGSSYPWWIHAGGIGSMRGGSGSSGGFGGFGGGGFDGGGAGGSW